MVRNRYLGHTRPGCAVRPRHPRTIHPMSAITMGSGGSGVEDPAGDRPQRPEGGRSERGTRGPHRHPGAPRDRRLARRDLPPVAAEPHRRLRRRRRLLRDLRLPDHPAPAAAPARPAVATWPPSGADGSDGCCRPRCSCSPRRWCSPGCSPRTPSGATRHARPARPPCTSSTGCSPSDSVDYLAAENAPSPVQHFWSLSVEEQFYFVWPILILVMVLAARRFGWNRDVAVLAGLAVLVTASLGYSIWETVHNPSAAYFVTPTRMWELGIGGLLAVVVAVRQRRGLGAPAAHRSPSACWPGSAWPPSPGRPGPTPAGPRSPAGRRWSPCWAPPSSSAPPHR